GSEPPTSSGNQATSTQLNVPAGLSVLPSGAVVVADTGNWLIEELEFAPSPPSISLANAGDGIVSLSWSSPVENGGAQVSDYEVLVFDESGAVQRSIDVSSASTSDVIAGLNDGTRYSFEVEAVNSIGTSAPSAALSAVPVGPGATTLPPPPVTLPVPTTLPPTTIAPGSAHSHHTTKEPLATVDLVKKAASVRYGFTTLLVRCTASRCTGTLRIVGKRVVHLTQQGIERAVTETYLASSDHFDLHGRRNVSVLVPVGSELSSLSKTGSLVVTAEFSVAHGKTAHYRLVLSAG
ncbi:MAG TPA: fibronectin type III domain-containing protein, partial [Acidimicrobiales bacterium]|nr:fibronectin type III domain-containing protein [Acidimicrobiales bacterium]